MKKSILQIFLYTFLTSSLAAQPVTIEINTLGPRKEISPYLYGKNNSLSDNPASPVTSAQWQYMREMGITMFRENGGNNATKYNWRRKLSSHPDWYNNVYAHNWDYAAASLQANIPKAQGMWAFQLAGKSARTSGANFNDWAFNRSQWWSGCQQNLAGGGKMDSAGGSQAKVNGNPSLYLENWTADSTTGILDHWFGTGGIGLNPENIRYWSMDNEPEIWNGTHDDIWPDEPTAEQFMQLYFNVAKKARTKFPGIKLVGPVPANEWQWFNWDGGKIHYNGKDYAWLEYFILRIAEEQQASGLRLLDVLDIHFYPGEKDPSQIMQLHRVFFDESYDYPGANGVKTSGTGTREYIFKRCNDWLVQYLGAGHGVTFSVSEMSLAKKDAPNLTALWYASTLGEFARNGVEIFTPWDWIPGMAEVMHLFTRYGQNKYIQSVSSDEQYISAYPTINAEGDSLTIFIVNRDLAQTRNINLNIKDFDIREGNYSLYTLSNLPSSETFISHTNNALKKSEIHISANPVQLSLAPLSVTALVVNRSNKVLNKYGELITAAEAESGALNGVVFSSSVAGYSGSGYVTGFDNVGDKVSVSLNVTSQDVYRIVIRYTGGDGTQKLIVNNHYADTTHLPAASSFIDHNAGGFMLNEGANTISIECNTGDVAIDRIEVYYMDRNSYHIVDLIDTLATEETRALHKKLQYQFGERIISGQTHDYYNEVKTLTGSSPMLRAGDFQHYTQGYPYLWAGGHHTYGYDVSDATVNTLISWYNGTGKKGIVSMHWHWHDPSGDLNSDAGTNTFYTQYTTFDIRQAVIPGTPEYDFVIRDIDSIAFQLKKFQNAGIPVLWRPLHEAGGGWFWWGAHGAAPCLALWDILIDRLKNYHQLHNLIWVWSSPEPDWYPGNDKVDLIGFDSYPGSFNYTAQKETFDNLYTITRGEKLIAMTENGPIADPDACLNVDAPWLYFMSWSNLVTEQNTQQHIKDVYSHPVVVTLESGNLKTGFDWRSSLYPVNWKPGFRDEAGRYLQDFSYAGYHQGTSEIPEINKNITDITQSPYFADNTGTSDVTSVIQKALDDVGRSGGGVVYMPAGTYRIHAADDSSCALRIAHDSTVLRGSGRNSTFLLNHQTNMRYKDILRIEENYANWFIPHGNITHLTFDLLEPTRILPVQSVEGFNAGDQVVITSTPTAGFIDEHKMTGYWTAEAIKGVAFLRRIDSVDVKSNLIIIDAPVRYALKTRDQARVYHAAKHIMECGIEDLSVGNIQNPNTGWDEESYTVSGTGAYEVHNAHAIQIRYGLNCWLKNVSTFKPDANTNDFHILSNGVKLNQSRQITIDSCNFEKPQYEGGGGNGYLYTLESNDCLVKNSRANDGRHNFDFKYPYSNGNVILNCRSENPRYGSDFHMYLSMANLFDACTLNGDYLESTFRPYGTVLHGYTSTQSVFYNTTGENYHAEKDYLIDSRQFGNGYIIGTSGTASEVNLDPVQGSKNGYFYNSSPRDFSEGIGDGSYLVPQSLYLDQLYRRKNDITDNPYGYKVKIIVKIAETGALLPNCVATIYNDTIVTDENGSAFFDLVPGSFAVSIYGNYIVPVNNRQFLINSDTTLTIPVNKELYRVAVTLLRTENMTPVSYTSILFGNQSLTTSSSGKVSFNVPLGSYDFSVNSPNYEASAGAIAIHADTAFTIFVVQTHANLRIRLRNGTASVGNATIIINNDSLVTNSVGEGVFNSLPVLTSHHYLIEKTGFAKVEGNVYLKTDTLVVVAMTEQPVSSGESSDKGYIELWPNPSEDQLHLKLPEDCRKGYLSVANLKGVEIHRQELSGRLVDLDTSMYPSGAYILKIVSGEKVWVKYFVRK